jgi:precorrin-6x reductase
MSHMVGHRSAVTLLVFTAVTMKVAAMWNITCVVLVRADVSEEHIASIIRVTRIGELVTTLAVTSNRSTLRRNAMLWLGRRFL